MNKRNISFFIIFTVLITFSISSVWGQDNNSSNTSQVTDNNAELHINILEFIVAVLTVFVTILIAAGFVQYYRFEKDRSDIRKYKEEAEDSVKKINVIAKEAEDSVKKINIKAKEAENSVKDQKSIEKEVRPILDRIKKAENEINGLISQIPQIPYSETPTKEYKEKYNDLAQKVESLETFGIPLTSDDYFAKATSLYYNEDYENALRNLDKVIELNPNYIAWYNKGIILSDMGKYEEAIKAYDKSLELRPNYAKTLVNKCEALLNLGKYDDALKICNEAIELKSDDDFAWYNLACAYSLKNDKENALKNLSKAIELNPKLKEDAKNDDDFKNLRDDPEFKRLVD